MSQLAYSGSSWNAYLRLMRLDRPVGTLLLLWPTLAALVLASGGVPGIRHILVFSLGTLLMRSAGCVINDYFDRELDAHVARTKGRPLATGELTPTQALVLFAVLLVLSASLLLLLNQLAFFLSLGGVAIAALYPLMKRWTYLPQVVLGAAFSWGLIMAYGAVQDQVPNQAWLLFMGSVFWIVAYDTMYAMVDRDDDIKVGIKSTAVLFGQHDRMMVGVLQGAALLTFILFAFQAGLTWGFALGLVAMAATFVHQQKLIRHRERDRCMQAFGNNVISGFCLFAGSLIEVLVFA